jgi:hypothetical protein
MFGKVSGKLVKVEICPCMGSSINPHNHIYAVHKNYDTGKDIVEIADEYVTLEKAQTEYSSSKVEFVVSKSHTLCPECQVYRTRKLK